MGQGIAHAGLRRQMHHPVDRLVSEQRLHPGAVGQVEPLKRETWPFPELRQARLLEADLVVVVDVVQPDDRLATRQQALGPNVPPEDFARYRAWGLEMGFLEVVAGPLVRSSYRAERVFARNNAGL